jgi:large subunit ribosomal protein L15
MSSLSLHNLRPADGKHRHRSKRVGRGNASGKGTTAGRGGKGQKARTGGRNRLKALGLRRLVMQTPKLRGFKSQYQKAVPVKVSAVEKAYVAGEIVSMDTLVQKGLVPSKNAKAKLLDDGGKLTKKLIVMIPASKTASEKITAAGGELKASAK